MRKFFDKYGSSFGEDEALQMIKRYLEKDNFARGGGGGSSYHSDPDTKLKELVKVYEMIEDFFESVGLDMRSYTEDSFRRGGGR